MAKADDDVVRCEFPHPDSATVKKVRDGDVEAAQQFLETSAMNLRQRLRGGGPNLSVPSAEYLASRLKVLAKSKQTARLFCEKEAPKPRAVVGQRRKKLREFAILDDLDKLRQPLTESRQASEARRQALERIAKKHSVSTRTVKRLEAELMPAMRGQFFDELGKLPSHRRAFMVDYMSYRIAGKGE